MENNKIKSIDLVWITVKNLKESVKYYSEILGFKVLNVAEEYKWAELQGPAGGCILGIGEACGDTDMVAGANATITLSVDDIEATKERLASQGVQMMGDICEIPGHVKLQLCADKDNNRFQLVQELSK